MSEIPSYITIAKIPEKFTGVCYIVHNRATMKLKDGRFHCETDAAIVYDRGRKVWYKNGVMHRLDGPALEDGAEKDYWINGTKYSIENHQKHPDVIDHKNKQMKAKPLNIATWVQIHGQHEGYFFIEDEGTYIYLKKGIRRHREDGPALIDKEGNKYWWQNDKKHRLDGPAIEFHDGKVEYWIDDVHYSKESYLKKIEELKTMFKPKTTKPKDILALEKAGIGIPCFVDEIDVPDDFAGCCYIEEYQAYYWLDECQERHRLDGPAIVCDDGRKEWHVHDLLHRIDGPAIERADGVKEYWINGTKFSEEKYLDHPEVIMAFQKTKAKSTAKPKLEHKITVPEKKEELSKPSDEDIAASNVLIAETYAKKHGYKFCPKFVSEFDAHDYTGKIVDRYGIVHNYVDGLLHDDGDIPAITSIHYADIKRYHQHGILHSINVPQSGVLYRSTNNTAVRTGNYYSINGMMFKTEQTWKMAIVAYEAAKRVVARKITSFAQSHLVSILAGSDIETVNIMAMFMATDKGKLLVNLVSGLIAEQLIDKVPVKYRIPFSELCTEFKIEAMAIGQEMFIDAGLDIIMNLVTSKAHTAIEELTRIDENLEGLPANSMLGEELFVENQQQRSPESLVM